MSEDDMRSWTYVTVHELWTSESSSGMGTYYVLVADFEKLPDVRRLVADTITLCSFAGLSMDNINGQVFIDALLKSACIEYDNCTITTQLYDAPEPDADPVVLTLLPMSGVCIEYGETMWEPEMFYLRYGTEM